MRRMNAYKNRIAGIAASAGLLTAGFLLSSPGEAKAEYTRNHPLSCQKVLGDGELTTSWGWSVKNETATLLCPLPDTSTLPGEDISSITVYTNDQTSAGGNFVRVQACALSRANLHLSHCGQDQSASGSGDKTLTLSTENEIGFLSDGAYSTYYPYLHVFMQSNSTVYEQRFLGYTVAS